MTIPAGALAITQQPKRISFAFMAIGLVLVGWLHLAVLLLTGLFGYFALERLSLGGRKAVGVILFVLLLGGMGYGFFVFARTATIAVPKIVEAAIPPILAFADSRGMELPEGYNYEALKADAITFTQGKLASAGKYAGEALRALVFFLIGIVVSVSLFLNTKVEPDDDPVTGRDSAARICTSVRAASSDCGLTLRQARVAERACSPARLCKAMSTARRNSWSLRVRRAASRMTSNAVPGWPPLNSISPMRIWYSSGASRFEFATGVAVATSASAAWPAADPSASAISVAMTARRTL